MWARNSISTGDEKEQAVTKNAKMPQFFRRSRAVHDDG